MQTAIRAASTAEMLEHEMKFVPTAILTETGFQPIEVKRECPTPVMVALMEDPEWLMTGIAWAAMSFAGRIEIMVEFGLGSDETVFTDIMAALPEQSKLWLEGWQMQVNSGGCWTTSGSIGRCAHNLIKSGYLLLGKERCSDAYGSSVGARTDVTAGTPGSPEFVRAVMGEAYLGWISAID